MSKIQIDINEELTNKMNELNQNIGYSKAKFIRTLINQCLNMTVVEFEDMVTGRNKPKDQPKAPDQPIDKPIKEKQKRDSDYLYPDFVDRESSTPNLLDIRKLKNYVFVDNFCDPIKDGYDGIVWVVQQKDPDEEQYIEEPDPNEPDDY